MLPSPDLSIIPALFALSSSMWVATISAAAAPPNIVMIVSDDQAWTDFGFMGHDVIQTLHLDKFASESAVFLNGYVPSSLCRASLATLLTGMYAHQHKICCNDPPDGVDRSKMLPFLKNAPTIPRQLKSRGYRSLQTGKFWEGHYSNGGFTDGMTTSGRHGGPGLKIGRETMQPIFGFVEDCIDPRSDAPRRNGQCDPFFIWYAPMLPHEPHNPPQRILKKYTQPGRDIRLAKYYAMCEWFDETCGTLLKYLDDKGLRENTLVVFVVDNGWVQRSGPRQRGQRGFTPKSKRSPYDGGVRTPIMLRWPNKITPGRHEGLVSTIDLAPTILSACGLNPTESMKGVDLLPIVQGESKLLRESVFGEIFVHTSVNIDRPALNLQFRWIRRHNWKLIVPADAARDSELYDLSKDPHETVNLISKHESTARSLRQRLDKWWNGRNGH